MTAPDLSPFRELGIEPLIAEKPAEPRDSSRLMVIDRKSGVIRHKFFKDLPDFLESGDCLVINESKVWKARIYAAKSAGSSLPAGRAERGQGTELLLVESADKSFLSWNLLCRKTKPGASYTLDGGIKAECLSRNADGSYLFAFSSPLTEKYLNENGTVPLPGYIEKKRKEKGLDVHLDKDDSSYQTVYASENGSIAAPTAGFHFTGELLERLRRKGVKTAKITLHVGWGTFKPIRGPVEEHKMLPEFCSVSETAAETVNAAKRAGGRVAAVGTSSVRTLEAMAGEKGALKPGSQRTGIFIYPGYAFRLPDIFITNLHVPDSPPLAMTAAFCGKELLLKAYAEAVELKYRFYSYGDSTLII